MSMPHYKQDRPDLTDAAKTSFLFSSQHQGRMGSHLPPKKDQVQLMRTVFANNPLVAAPPSSPSAPNNPKPASSAQRKASPQRSHLDKRITSHFRYITVATCVLRVCGQAVLRKCKFSFTFSFFNC
ncbi:hypothetical protein MKX03_004254 [Papaver bracteatum]|nr:hypothetical protein MKX03_004254 [Papaver bracteatum]